MTRGSDHKPIFEATPAGLLIPAGSSTELWNQDSSTYVFVKARALKLKELIEANGLDVYKNPSLLSHIKHATELSDAWLCNQMESITFQHLLGALQIDRIAQATSKLPISDQTKRVLSDLLDGTLNLLGREQSKAKDTLWELELFQMLSRHGIRAHLGEPDILLSFSGPSLGIACKKLYSEGNVSKVISQAVHQIERDVEFGIVALNIDDLLPDESLLKAGNFSVMTEMLSNFVMKFMHRQERHFRRYLTPGRTLSVLVSCATIADIPSAEIRFMNARQSVTWSLPGLSSEKAEQMQFFMNAFRAQYPA